MSDILFTASKTLPDFLSPLSLAFIALVLLAALGRLGRRNRLALLVIAAGIWLSGSGWLSELLVRSLEGRETPPGEIPAAQVIVVLGGATEPALHPRSSVELNDAGDRLLHAARLFRAGKSPRILACSGRANPSLTDTPEASDMAEILRFLGVPAEAVLEERRSRNTWENAVEARRVLEPLGLRRILLVTSAMHMPRAARLFRRVGFEVVPAPTDFLSVDRTGSALDDGWARAVVSLLLPSADNLALTTRALREHLGLAVWSWLTSGDAGERAAAPQESSGP